MDTTIYSQHTAQSISHINTMMSKSQGKQEIVLMQLSALDTHSIRCQHVLCLLLFVLDMHLKWVSLLKVLLEQGQLLLHLGGRGHGLSARGDGRRATLAHELELLDWGRWGGKKTDLQTET